MLYIVIVFKCNTAYGDQRTELPKAQRPGIFRIKRTLGCYCSKASEQRKVRKVVLQEVEPRTPGVSHLLCCAAEQWDLLTRTPTVHQKDSDKFKGGRESGGY